MDALHSCDNPPCVNPAHLRWGTAAENVADMVSRRRYNNTRKLTAADANAIRQARISGETGVSVARRFGVSQQTVCDIFKGRYHLS